ncbi:hypothetical protein [Kitasatospora sp. NPDC051164]|uniref:hypothetical protein n=1 Tax=Kitasatospora sp. NPDC051164 TaxID=3364055 RepID=UPI0037A1693C
MSDRRPSRKRSREIRAAGGKFTVAMRANDAARLLPPATAPEGGWPLGPVDRWRGTGGPDRWERAWDRAISELGPVRAARQEGPYDPYAERWTEGAAGLALTYYLLAVVGDRSVEAVSTDDVRVVAELPDTGSAWPAVARIDALAERAGHRLDAPDDPVAACWRALRVDCSPTDIPDDMQHDWSFRWGADKVVSLSVVLARLAAAGRAS